MAAFDIKKTHTSTYPFISSSPTDAKETSTPNVLITDGARGPGRAIALSYARHGSHFLAVGDPEEDFGSIAHDLIAAATPEGHEVDPDTAPRAVLVKLDLDAEGTEEEAKRAAKLLRIGFTEGDKMSELDVIVNVVKDLQGDGVQRNRLLDTYLVPLLRGGAGGKDGGVIVNLVVLRQEDEISQWKNAIYRYHGHGEDNSTTNSITYTVLVRQTLIEREDGLILLGDTIAWLTREERQWLNGRYIDFTWDMQELSARKEEIIKEDKLRA